MYLQKPLKVTSQCCVDTPLQVMRVASCWSDHCLVRTKLFMCIFCFRSAVVAFRQFSRKVTGVEPGFSEGGSESGLELKGGASPSTSIVSLKQGSGDTSPRSYRIF